MHDQHPTMSYVDLNRSGVALMEIVSKPDMRSADEAKAYVTKLRSILRYLGTCDGNMDEGSMRADVNVSVRKPGGDFGTRCEIKNVNSIRFVGQAIEYEARRQIDISRMAVPSTRKPGCSTRRRARPARCAPRKKRTTTAISPIPTCCRWNSTTPSSTKSRPHAAGTAGRQEGAAGEADFGLTPTTLDACLGEGDRRLFRGRGRRPRRQDGRQLGHQRAVRAPEQKARH
jgi:hypothetical protein